MFTDTRAFSSFSVNDLAAAKEFYSNILGLKVEESPMGLTLKVAGSNGTFVYSKPDHVPATYTILNFPVEDIDAAADALIAKGIIFEQYPDMTDEKGIAHSTSKEEGPSIAWFKDPAGNILSILS